MQNYEEYKDSGVEWIGNIPEHWVLKRLKFVVDSKIDNRGRTPVFGSEGIPMLEVKQIRDDNMYPDKKFEKFVLPETVEEYERNKLKEGDVLIATVGATAGKCCIVPSDFKFFIAQNVIGFRADNFHNPKYLYYSIESTYFKNSLLSINKTNTIDNLKVSIFINNWLISPPLEEQTQIANYLDKKTAQIDDLIAKKEKLIELLKEERTATINQNVTKGIDPNVPMKDSGIEWLGEIPESWKLKTLRYIGTCQNGISAGAEYFGFGFPFLSYSDVYKNEVLPETVNGLANSSEKDQKHYSVKENDVFFTRTSETIDEIGIASTCIKTIENSVFAGFLIRFRPQNGMLYKGFSKYFFRCFIPRVFFVKEMNLVTRASLSQELLKRLPVLLPDFDEQIDIAGFLDAETSRIDMLIDKYLRQIELLKEYKTALISEVVTGKVDVRDEKTQKL